MSESKTATRRAVLYSVTTRYGARQCTSLREARKIRSGERRDGWPSEIRDLRTAERS